MCVCGVGEEMQLKIILSFLPINCFLKKILLSLLFAGTTPVLKLIQRKDEPSWTSFPIYSIKKNPKNFSASFSS